MESVDKLTVRNIRHFIDKLSTDLEIIARVFRRDTYKFNRLVKFVERRAPSDEKVRALVADIRENVKCTLRHTTVNTRHGIQGFHNVVAALIIFSFHLSDIILRAQ